jgi:hypothetical protein
LRCEAEISCSFVSNINRSNSTSFKQTNNLRTARKIFESCSLFFLFLVLSSQHSMSSTPTISIDAPSSRIHSANNKAKEETTMGNTNRTTEKTSRPPSASQKTAADTSRALVIAATGAGISPDAPAAGSDEPTLTTVTSFERPPSANQQLTTDSSTEFRPRSAPKNASQDPNNRPSSAAKVDLALDSTTTEVKTSRLSSANQKTDELASHGYSIVTTNSRPSSASQKVDEPTIKTNSRPSSASQKIDEPTTKTNSRPPSARQKTDESTTTISSRPPSAKQKTDESAVNDSTTKTSTSSRPPSASQKANELTANNSTTAPVGSRPPSANQKSNEFNANDSNIVPIDSRASTASQTTDITNVNELNNITAPINSRPPSANQKTDSTTVRTGSRPPSASRKQDETTTGDSKTEQQTTSLLFNSNDPNITQPIIGRPPSAAKKAPTDESDTTASPNTLTENGPSSNENNPIETTPTTPRIGSASKNSPVSTTTENNS